jgi:nucleotide-binding universal stress UspA family protein
MSWKTLLVHLDRDARSAARLEIGIALAEALDAHLVGLFALNAEYIPSFVRAEAGSLVEEAVRRNRAEAEAAARKAFDAAVAKRGNGRTEWRASNQDALGAVRLSARYADVVLIGQHESGTEERAGVSPGFADEIVLSTGRPVLLIPYAGRFGAGFKRALIAWNGTSEAARAVSDALPLLTRAEAVEVISFDPPGGLEQGRAPGHDVALWLARHGVNVTVAVQPSGGEDVGALLLSRADDFGAQLLVMGAYGHSRMREMVLGGVTRTVLGSATVPVLMSR